MLKKICKQREKIEKLTAKENDAAEKLTQLRQELAAEKDALDEMEKEHLFSLMRQRELSLEETIALLQQDTENLQEEENEDVTYEVREEPAELQGHTDSFEDADIEEEAFAEDTADALDKEQEDTGGFFSSFTKRNAAGDNDFWQ